MRRIDIETWPRREHFELYRTYHQPHFNVCAPVDVTGLWRAVKERGASLNTAITYLLARVANEIPEFRRRVRDDGVVEHDVVHPATTVMADDEVFTFAFFEFAEHFDAFARHVAEVTAHVRKDPSLSDPPGRDDLLFMTAIPWVVFTSFSHAIPAVPEDSIPRLAWGRVWQEGGLRRMPLSVQGHHAVVDGLHVGRYFERVERHCADPETLLGSA
jgi:chloramphenicol O-acetyltransferase type A